VQTDLSYRALLKLPSVGRLLLGLQIARIAKSMMSVTIVLFALAAYGSPPLAGLATFVGIFPGLLVSPLAGALLDRHGRSRLVVLDYVVALVSLTLIGGLALWGTLPAWLLIVIVAVASLTMPLSATGLRSLLPLIVPRHLWERVNAIDSTGYVVATIIGPPLAAAIVALNGGPLAFMAIGISFGIAAIVIARIPDPPALISSKGSLLTDAGQALTYTWKNPTLRGLGFSISVLNVAGGILTIVVPLIVLNRLLLSETVVGVVIAVQGLTGIVSAILFGRHDSRNRERMMLVIPMLATGLALILLLFKLNLAALVFVMAITGFLNGPLDIALFTLRQRRTDPAWTGRAFAVSMSFNYVGTPIGAAVAGIVATRSIEAALVLGVVSCLVAGVLAAVMIPSE
jgi:MFS family permease